MLPSSSIPSLKETLLKMPGKALDLGAALLNLVLACLEALADFLDYLRFPQRTLEERKIKVIEDQNALLKEGLKELKKISPLRPLELLSSTDPSESSDSNPVVQISSSEVEEPIFNIDSLGEEEQGHVTNLHEFAKQDTDVPEETRNAQNEALKKIHPLQLLYFSLLVHYSKFEEVGKSKPFPETRQKIVKIRIIRHLEAGFLRLKSSPAEEAKNRAIQKQFCEKVGITEETLDKFIGDTTKLTFSEEPIPPKNKLSKFRWLTSITYPESKEGAVGLVETVIELQGRKRASENEAST